MSRAGAGSGFRLDRATTRHTRHTTFSPGLGAGEGPHTPPSSLPPGSQPSAPPGTATCRGGALQGTPAATAQAEGAEPGGTGQTSSQLHRDTRPPAQDHGVGSLPFNGQAILVLDNLKKEGPALGTQPQLTMNFIRRETGRRGKTSERTCRAQESPELGLRSRRWGNSRQLDSIDPLSQKYPIILQVLLTQISSKRTNVTGNKTAWRLHTCTFQALSLLTKKEGCCSVVISNFF